MCAYLESYLKDMAFNRIEIVNSKLSSIPIPRNLVRWEILSPKAVAANDENFRKDLKFENLKISIKKKDLDAHISASPHRTEMLFKKIGIDLTIIDGFVSKKEIINSIVVKRNQIVHHNDEANDVSMSDLILYINNFIEYIDSITKAIKMENSN